MNGEETLYHKLLELPILDPHTHINAGAMAARDLGDVFLYHMVVSDLYAAGCPDGTRLDNLPYDARMARVAAAIPYLPAIRNTSCYWGVRIILKDLYGWEEEITESNWQKLNDLIRERSSNSWGREIAKKAGIQRFVTEWWRKDPSASDLFDYSLEWAFFTRSQWGQFDTALLELEYSWNQEIPGPPLPVTLDRSTLNFQKTIRTLSDVHEAVAHFVEKTPYTEVLNVASHFSTDITYRLVTDDEMAAALTRREQAGNAERDIYANYISEAYFTEMEKKHPDVVLQFSLGAEPLPFETGSKMRSETVFELAQLFARHSKAQFNLHIASEHQNQAFCSLARELPNISFSGYWWHNFFPGSIRKVMETRLDMVPVNRTVGFLSDAYCVDWSYAKSVIIRKQMAEVLSRKIEQGQYTEKSALDIAYEMVYGTSATLLGLHV
jgi:glucuronate isomerase